MTEDLKIIISAEIKKLQDAMKKAKKSVVDFADNAKKKVDDFAKEFEGIGNASKKGLAVVAGAVAGAGTALLALSASTKDYRTEQEKLQTAFETAGGSAEQAKTTYNDLFRIIGQSDVAAEAANHLAQITTNEKELSEWTTIAQGVWATFGDSIEQAGFAEAINHTISLGEVQGTLADALEWSGISVENFNEKLALCNTEEERAQLIQSTLNGLYGEAAANYEKNAASIIAQNEAQSRLNDAMAAAGEAVAPIQTALTNLAATLLEKLTPHIQSFIDNYLPAITEALSSVGEAIGKVIGWISDHWELVSTLGTIVLAVAAAFAVLSTTLSVVSAVMGFIASPIAGVVVAIAAVIAIIVVCVKYWDEIKAKVVEVATAIWSKVEEMAAKVGEFFSNMGENISNAVSNAKEAAVNKFNEITSNIKQKAGEAFNTAKEKFTNLKNSISNNIELAKSAVSTKFGNIYTTITSKASEAFTKAQEKFNGIKDAVGDAMESARKFVSDKIQAVKDLLGLKGFSWSLPKPSFPKFSVSGGEAPWGFMGQGSLPKIKISWNALGGVFEKPTVFGYGGSLQGIAEDGAEAVVPLERNTEWINKVAAKMADAQGNRPIVLTVDGKVFAQTSINAINQLTRQTGHLGLNLV